MSLFEPAVDLVLRHEGGLEQDYNYDSGLCTKYGISLIFLRKNIKANATDADVKTLNMATAKEIYRQYFWNKYRFQDIESQKMANRLFDLSVNCGPKEAFMLIQRAANSCGHDLTVDGILGARSIAAINNPDINNSLYTALINHAEEYYKKIANISHNNKFLAGWLARLHDTP